MKYDKWRKNLNHMSTLTGYSSEAYAETYKNLGQLRWLNIGYNGCVLERGIPSTPYKDLTSLYPVYVPAKTSPFYSYHRVTQQDLEYDKLKQEGFISLTVVTDPLDNTIKDYLLLHGDSLHKMGFDLMRGYKDHYIVKLQEPWNIHYNHYRNIKKAVKAKVSIENTTLHWTITKDLADKFYDLYINLIERHAIIGFPNYTKEQIYQQLLVPGSILMEAKREGRTIGMMLFYLEWPNVRYHLACYSDEGYENSASFLLMYEGMNFFKQLGCNLLVLGAGAGTVTSSEGLNRFKSGWTDYSRKNFILFKVIDKDIYNELSKGKDQDYLPAYRS